ncbi:MAG: hypothetical protein ACOX5R_10740 [bacterium]
MNKQKKLILAALLIVLMVPIILIMALVAIRMQYTDGPGSDPLSQTERDLRSMQIALDSFHMDLARYPLESASHYIQDASLMHGSSRYMFLTTPVAYLSALPVDPFAGDSQQHYRYFLQSTQNSYLLAGMGPDQDADLTREILSTLPEWSREHLSPWLYDPSNGSVSSGDIIRLGPQPME